jgi:hypothetical protein
MASRGIFLDPPYARTRELAGTSSGYSYMKQTRLICCRLPPSVAAVICCERRPPIVTKTHEGLAWTAHQARNKETPLLKSSRPQFPKSLGSGDAVAHMGDITGPRTLLLHTAKDKYRASKR